MAYTYLNLDYLDLMSGGDEADRRRLLEMLVQHLRAYPGQMQLTLKAQDWGKLEQQAHYFKSTLPFTGCEALIAVHHTVYQLAQARGSRSELHALLIQVQELSRAVLREAEQELEKG